MFWLVFLVSYIYLCELQVAGAVRNNRSPDMVETLYNMNKVRFIALDYLQISYSCVVQIMFSNASFVSSP